MKTKARALIPVTLIAIGALAVSPGAVRSAPAKVRVVASLPNLGSIASAIGGDRIDLTTIAVGTQDAHFVDPKPSFMVKLKGADLLLVNGLDLEIGWIPPITQGARNPKILQGAAGYIDCSTGVPVMEIPTSLSRAEGDIHPYGNPHYLTDPLNAEVVAGTIAEALKRADPPSAEVYEEGRKAFVKRLHEALFGKDLVDLVGGSKLAREARAGTLDTFLDGTSIGGAALRARLGGWLGRMQAVKGKPVVTYHKDFSYFAARFGMQVVDYVEPKPGIQPSAKHLEELVAGLKQGEARVIFTRPYLEHRSTDYLAEKTGIKIVTLPLEVGGAPQAIDFFTLFDFVTGQIAQTYAGLGPGGEHRSVSQMIGVLFLPFLACLILTGIHVYLGIHVISRKVIFVDIALAQIAALGATVAFLLGYDPRSEGAYFLSLGFAIFAAIIFALTRTKHERVPQEAVIGLTYATASATAILLADISPHGAEHLHDLLAGSIVWVTPAQILKTAMMYSLIGIFHFAFRKRFLLISIQPEEAYAQGVNVRMWDFLFYLSFGVVITSSVQIAGVLLVFCYLVAPSVFAVMFFDDLKKRLLTGWAMATVVSAIGLLFSYDRPSGPTIMVGFALALILGATVKAIFMSPRRSRALGIATVCAALLVGVGWTLYRFRPAGTIHPDEHVEEDARSSAPEHAVGEGTDAFRAALRDTHENVRARAVAQLAATGDPRVISDLVSALHDQAPAVREAAARELGHLGSRSALPALKQSLKSRDEDEWVGLRLAQGVALLGDAEGIPVLLDLAKEGEGKLTRLEALTTLLKLAAIPGPAPSDTDSEEGRAALRSVQSWWSAGKGRLRWNAGSGSYSR